MNKLSWILLIYAVGATTYVLATRQTGSASGTTAFVEHPGDRSERAIRTEARALLRKERESFVREIEQRIARLQDLQEALGEEVSRVKKVGGAPRKDSAATSGKIDKLIADFKALRKRAAGNDVTKRVAALEAELPELETRVVNLELRPTSVRQDPRPSKPTEPEKPKLPEPERPDAAAVQSAVAKAMQAIQSNDEELLVRGIEGVRKHNVPEAVPRLIEILGTSKHFFARMAAAAALGDMKSCDAVPALAGALVDSEPQVAQQANRSVRAITGFDSGISPTARIRERRRAKGAIVQWWRMNEDKVRTALHQPKKPG